MNSEGKENGNAGPSQTHGTPGQEWKSYESVFTNAKAGMASVDKERVKKIVYEMSKGSPCFENEQRKQARVEERILKLKAHAKQLSQKQLDFVAKNLNGKIADLEAGRNLSRIWLHVDMDAFFASVEELDDPSLKNKPMAVGGKSMISTANYEARKYGVRSAMPGFIALKLCPQLVFVKPDFKKYQRASEAAQAIFRSFDPKYDRGSLDEAYLDCTEYCKRNSVSGAQVGEELRMRVFQETKLTCSVGIAGNRMLAKVSSDINKPNGQHEVEPTRSAVLKFMSTLPVQKVPGIGKVTAQVLGAFGITVGSDLLEKRGLISSLFSQCASTFLLEVGLGLGRTEHWEIPADGVNRKGISCERTFPAISLREDLEQKASELAVNLSEHMAREHLKGQTVTLKLKLTSFEVRTRTITLPHYVSSADEILKPVLKLLTLELPVHIRLMGVRVSNFWEDKMDSGQMTLTKFLEKNVDDEGEVKRSEEQVLGKNSLEPFSCDDHGISLEKPTSTQGNTPLEDTASTPVSKIGAASLQWNDLESKDDDPQEWQSMHHCLQAHHGEAVPKKIWTCEKCNKSMDISMRQEHEDFHFATELKREQEKINRIMQVGLKRGSDGMVNGQKNRTRRHKGAQMGTLDMFLTKKPRRDSI